MVIWAKTSAGNLVDGRIITNTKPGVLVSVPIYSGRTADSFHKAEVTKLPTSKFEMFLVKMSYGSTVTLRVT